MLWETIECCLISMILARFSWRRTGTDFRWARALRVPSRTGQFIKDMHDVEHWSCPDLTLRWLSGDYLAHMMAVWEALGFASSPQVGPMLCLLFWFSQATISNGHVYVSRAVIMTMDFKEASKLKQWRSWAFESSIHHPFTSAIHSFLHYLSLDRSLSFWSFDKYVRHDLGCRFTLSNHLASAELMAARPYHIHLS